MPRRYKHIKKLDFSEFCYDFENAIFEKKLKSATKVKILVCNVEAGYKNVCKICNLSFIFQILIFSPNRK